MDKDIKEYFEKHYQNEKQRTMMNINKQLWIDFQEICLNLSRKSKEKITASSEVRKLMVRFIIENKKNE